MSYVQKIHHRLFCTAANAASGNNVGDNLTQGLSFAVALCEYYVILHY
ncbi:hypothetical protein Trichorick_00544 [Candidatus Trichorickettsia mobilis]|uniref:Uncharacterized protein n=1 Tax=Candidatus Trichorickettsia mobilis TaxID=1346319 RepID=A0ABZ0URJ9_9RICK|nr:hypothetical protein Trichorick_00544 [Candidatus Trichorickettsia mobilis]